MDRRYGFFAIAALIAATVVAIVRRRPVKRPAPDGVWKPVHR